MKSCESNVHIDSDYYLYTKSLIAQQLFFYPVAIGHFHYEPGYKIERSAYDSYLLLYVEQGSLLFETPSWTEMASAGEFVLLDCYQPHHYETSTGAKCLWLHFDGPQARGYFDLICQQNQAIFSVANPLSILHKMEALLELFAKNTPLNEAFMSKQITDILTYLLLSFDGGNQRESGSQMGQVLSYLQENFSEKISIEDLAGKALLSPYHFIRVFKKETGYTPHDYLLNLRINSAKYMLKSTQLAIKDICFNSGFNSESSFCTSFKKRTGMTPKVYRYHTGSQEPL